MATVTNQRALSKSDWEAWISEHRNAAFQSFCYEPERLIAEYNREKALTRDYVGREILELLQNAADAAEASAAFGSVRIELSPSYLIVANTGSPFTPEGIMSLRISDLSPKRHSRDNFIGNKGLGFRAVLNWSLQPIILSHNLAISYSPQYAEKVIKEFAEKDERIHHVLSNEFSYSGVWCAPLLRFPYSLADNAHQDELFKRCLIVAEQGYDTVIGMPFDKQSSYEHALHQIDMLDACFLLFTNSLEYISIDVHEKYTKEWIREKNEQFTLLHESFLNCSDLKKSNITNHKTSSWEVYSTEENIPEELVEDKNDPSSYALVIARPIGNTKFIENLYSFFPTSVKFPVKFLCHATLELEQNRKHIQEKVSNIYILEQLAVFISRIIENIACEKNSPWEAIDAVSSIPHMQNSVLGFKEKFLAIALSSRFYPTISGEVVTGCEALLLKGATSEWLPAQIFPNVVELRDDNDWKFFETLAVPCLTANNFSLTIKNHAHILDKAERAGLIAWVKNRTGSTDFCDPVLFIDSNGEMLSKGDKFYPPSEQVAISVPTWTKIKIVDQELWQEIRKQLYDKNNLRDIVFYLEDFGIQEYAMLPIIRGIVKDATQYINGIANLDEKNAVRIELLSVLAGLYKDAHFLTVNPPLAVYVPTQSGEWKPASKVYIGEGFGTTVGKILQELFHGNVALLVAPLELAHLSQEDSALLCKFYTSWLGIAEWPRKVQLELHPEQNFKAYAKKKWEYPLFSGDTLICSSPDECHPRFNVESFEHLETILEKSPYHSIVAWLAKDSRFVSLSDFQDSNGYATAVKKNGRKPLRIDSAIPSYILWKIRTAPWVLASTGDTLAPEDCFMGESALEKMFPAPSPLTSEQERQFGLLPREVVTAFDVSGVVMSFGRLESDKIYEVLLALPRKDPMGKKARAFYRWLLAEDFAPNMSGSAYIEFCAHGMIFCQKEGKELYAPVKDTLHVDVEGIPAQILTKENIAQFPKRRGAQKVRKIFGIQTVDKNHLREEVESFDKHHRSDSFASDYKQCLRYIVSLRQLQSPQHQANSAIKRTDLILASSLVKKVEYKGMATHHSLEAWDFVVQGDSIYILYHDRDGSRSLLANAIGDALASISGIADGAQFSRIFECEEAARRCLTQKLAGEEYEEALQEMLGHGEAKTPRILLPFVEPKTHNATIQTQPEQINSSPSEEYEPTIQDITLPLHLSDGVLTVTEITHTPSLQQPKGAVPMRVGSQAPSAKQGQGVSQLATQTKGEAGELLAFRFEETRGRFPLRVNHLTGYVAPGCDILSFATVEAKDAFLSTHEAKYVARLIEAKMSADGTFELSENEVQAAEGWRDKYYVYCFRSLSAQREKRTELFILQSPLSTQEARLPSKVRFDVTKAMAVSRFELAISEAEID